jgi:predicted Zn-ribbon and HTH transcriptional regulator
MSFLALSVPNLILTYVVVMLAALTGVVVYTEMRRRRFEPRPSEDRIFRCGRCGYVYTDDSDVDRSRCSQCGQTNEAIRF